MANELTDRNRTLGELMTELRARLGFVTQGGASSGNEQIIKSFLQEAHDYVFEKLQPPAIKVRTVLDVVGGSYLYDWVDDANDGARIDPGQVVSIGVLEEDGSVRNMLRQRTTDIPRRDLDTGEPTSYSTLNGQLELYPVPNANYKLQIEYLSARNRFEQQSDRPSVPDRLVFLLALANAKAHYRHPDSTAAGSMFESLLASYRAKQRENKRYFVQTGTPERELHVVRTADGRFVLG